MSRYSGPMMTRPYPVALYNSRFFVWQTHMYGTGQLDSLGPGDVFMRRSMPCTPAGDLVCSCKTGQEAERIALHLNDQHRITLEEAILIASTL